jgi:hypothetical protein
MAIHFKNCNIFGFLIYKTDILKEARENTHMQAHKAIRTSIRGILTPLTPKIFLLFTQK